MTTPEAFWLLVAEYCTPAELDALHIRAAGATYREGGATLGITKQAFHRRIQRATARINSQKHPRSG